MQVDLLRLDDIVSCEEDKLLCGNLCLHEGEVLGIIGMRDSGIDEFIDILLGRKEFKKGCISINDRIVSRGQCFDALGEGIKAVHSSSRLNNKLTVAENIFLTSFKKPPLIVRQENNYNKAKELLELLGIDVDPNVIAEELPVSKQHQIILAKSLYENTKIVVLENLHQSYTENEKIILSKLIKVLNEKGVSFIIKYYNLDYGKFIDCMDKMLVLRNGNSVGYFCKTELLCEKNKIMAALGRKNVVNTVWAQNTENSEKTQVIKVEKLTTTKNQIPVSFNLFTGDILFITDDGDSKAEEIIDVITGRDISSYLSGKVYYKSVHINIYQCSDMVKRGVYLIQEDATSKGLCYNLSMGDNLLLMKDVVLKQKLRVNTQKYLKFLEMEFCQRIGIDYNTYRNKKVINLDRKIQYELLFYKGILAKAQFFVLIHPFADNDEDIRQLLIEKINDLSSKGIVTLIVEHDLSFLNSTNIEVLDIGKAYNV